jgi:hypothetical protein
MGEIPTHDSLSRDTLNKQFNVPGGCEMLNHYLHEWEMKMRHREALRQTEQRRLLRQAGTTRNRWPPRPGRWLLRHLGCLLVNMGQQLQRFAQPQAISFEGRTND